LPKDSKQRPHCFETIIMSAQISWPKRQGLYGNNRSIFSIKWKCATLCRNQPHTYKNGDLCRTKSIRRQEKTLTVCLARFPLDFYSFRKLKKRSRHARNITLCVISDVVLRAVAWKSLLTPHIEGALSTQCGKSWTLILSITDICCSSHSLGWQNTGNRQIFAEVPPRAALRAAIHGPRDYTSWEWPGHLLRPAV
jgi:hypothetical protein